MMWIEYKCHLQKSCTIINMEKIHSFYKIQREFMDHEIKEKSIYYGIELVVAKTEDQIWFKSEQERDNYFVNLCKYVNARSHNFLAYRD